MSAWKATTLLPRTAFPARANARARDAGLIAAVASPAVYERQRSDPRREGEFVLHAGPPYANGQLHLGHFVNHTLKDFVLRSKLAAGRRVAMVPGWDCHGLPIEQRVVSKHRGPPLDALGVRRLANKAAWAALEDQKATCRGWAILGDWDNHYATLHPRYEAAQLRVFHRLVQDGRVYRDLKPVYWSPSSQTALAEAELEYPGLHTSRAINAVFRVTAPSPALRTAVTDPDSLYLAIWTTTPWTIPANRAIAVHPEIEYRLLYDAASGRTVVVADALADSLEGLSREHPDRPGVLTGAELVGTEYENWTGSSNPVLAGEHVTAQAGTGLVHTAPGHGHDDFAVCRASGIGAYCPVDHLGRFTAEAGAELAGKAVLGDGQRAVLERLGAQGHLLSVDDHQHKYPYDWRTKKPVIIRATEQWFVRLDAELIGRATELIAGTVGFVPDSGLARLQATLASRQGDWCISRQRPWGVPIPVFYEAATGQPLLTDETIEHVIGVVGERGTDAWFEEPVAALLPPALRGRADELVKGTDTMDVWFDSGVSWFSVLGGDQAADLYLEGSDQHRGWFQSSLLTSVAMRDRAPYRAVVTHGFTLDGKGRKMSKSLGNVVDPVKLQKRYGTDVLRMWVASCDYTTDMLMGDSIMAQVVNNYTRLRNTMRFLLGVLDGYQPGSGPAAPAADPLNRYALAELDDFVRGCQSDYDAFAFAKAHARILRFTRALSAAYFDPIKDTLYCDARDSALRRETQGVLWRITDALTVAIAPLLPLLAQDVHSHTPGVQDGSSVVDRVWPAAEAAAAAAAAGGDSRPADVAALLPLLADAQGALETLRKAKEIGAAGDARLVVHAPRGAEPIDAQLLRRMAQVSQVSVQQRTDGGDGFIVEAAHAHGEKCPRCWLHYEVLVGDNRLCARCDDVVSRSN